MPEAAFDAPLPLVLRRRGEEPESLHRGWMVLVEDGRERAVGDPGTSVFSRSCTKPFQALAFVASGAADRFECTQEELALACSSHDGTTEQRDLARRMLERAGLGEEALRCGPSEPYGEEARRGFWARGEKPSPLIHNCSGKHAAFVLTQKHLGGDPSRYLEPASPLQSLARELVAQALDVPESALGAYVDGCSAPTYRPPLRALALGFARLADPETAPPTIAPHLARIRDAIAAHPRLYSGNRRLCAALLEASRGGVIPKNGADGVYAFGVRGRRAGFAVKIEDGATRGYVPVVMAVLRKNGFLDDAEMAGLERFLDARLKNSAGLVTGREEVLQVV